MSIAILFALVALVGSRDPAHTPGTVPSVENIRLSDPAMGFPYAEEPHVAVDSLGRVFVGWKELAGLTTNGPVGFASSADGGQTWTKRHMERTSTTATQGDPWLSVDGRDRLYYARLDAERTGTNRVVVSRSDDGGLTWGPLGNAADGSGFPDKSAIGSDRNATAYVSYSEGRTNLDNWRVRVSRSIDGGASWSHAEPIAIGRNLFGSVIATGNDGRAYVAWIAPGTGNNNIMFATSSNHGGTWSSPVRVNPVDGTAATNFITPTRLAYPSMATNSSGSVFLAWADAGRGHDLDILVSRSDDGGASWSAPVRVNDTLDGDHWSAALAVDAEDRLHVGWYDTRTGGVNVYYATSNDRGVTWSPNLRITTRETPTATTTRLSEYFGIAADRVGNAYIAWTDWRDGGPAIYFARVPGCVAPAAPIASNNGPVQVGQTLRLTASTVEGAVYAWSGPNGFRSNLRNPSIANITTAASGQYSVTATVGGCVSIASMTTVTVLAGSCTPGMNTLCLNSSRFAVRVDWRAISQGTNGVANAFPLTSDTGYFWFFSSNNVELVIKVVDGRAVNSHFWVFYGALSDVEYTITVTDMLTGAMKTYFNPQGRLASVADTSAF